MQDPQYRAAYERAAREIAQTDAVIPQPDAHRAELGILKVELAARQLQRFQRAALMPARAS